MRDSKGFGILKVSVLCILALGSYAPTLEAQGQATINVGGSLPIKLSGSWSSTQTVRRTEIRGPSSEENSRVLMIETNDSNSENYHLQVNPFMNGVTFGHSD